MLFFTKLAIKNLNFQFWVKILVCPNFLGVRASTDVERGPKFQLEPVQNAIGMWVEPDKSRCMRWPLRNFCTFNHLLDSYRNVISKSAVGFNFGNFTLTLALGKKSFSSFGLIFKGGKSF